MATRVPLPLTVTGSLRICTGFPFPIWDYAALFSYIYYAISYLACQVLILPRRLRP